MVIKYNECILENRFCERIEIVMIFDFSDFNF